MVSIRSGIFAGAFATFVISAFMLMKNATKQLPDVHIIHSWSAALDMPTHPGVGWIAHLVFCTVIGGIAFAFLAPRLPSRTYLMKGLMFGGLVWVLMMLVFMPLAGEGIFAIHDTMMVPLVTLVLYLIYGSVLGTIYSWGVDPVPPQKS